MIHLQLRLKPESAAAADSDSEPESKKMASSSSSSHRDGHGFDELDRGLGALSGAGCLYCARVIFNNLFRLGAPSQTRRSNDRDL